MRILLVNKFYYRRGGADIYVLDLEKLLTKHGHEVAVFAMQHPENLANKWSKYFPQEIRFSPSTSMWRTLIRPFGLGDVKREFSKLLDDFRPDVVHANNIHTQLSPVIMELAKKRGIHTVWTLHDYKLLCPCYVCRRNRDVCELCFMQGLKNRHNNLKHCIRHKCIKNSIVGSIIGYWEALYWNPIRLQNVTDTFISPSQFMAKKMAQGGFSRSKIHVLQHYIDAGKCNINTFGIKDNYYCYLGRLSEEKGLETLIDAANRMPEHRLIIIGEGPMKNKLQNLAMENITFVGALEWDKLKQFVNKAQFTVIPSEWYEVGPLTAIESLCLGTPVLGARIGNIPALIDEPSTGLTFESGSVEDLTCKIEQMYNMNFSYEDIATTSRCKFESESYYTQLMNIYAPCN